MNYARDIFRCQGVKSISIQLLVWFCYYLEMIEFLVH